MQATVSHMGQPHQLRPLMTYMLHANPGMGLLAMDRALFPDAEIRRQLRWTEHVTSDYLWKKKNGHLSGDTEKTLALQELGNLLAANVPWWGHLYVAEVLRGNAELRARQLTTLLKADADRDVREMAGTW